MAKKPKKEWQIKVRMKLDAMGIGYRELADRMGESEAVIRQAMCDRDDYPLLRGRIIKYLGIEVEE